MSEIDKIKIKTTPSTTPHCLQTIAQNELLALTNIATPKISASFPFSSGPGPGLDNETVGAHRTVINQMSKLPPGHICHITVTGGLVAR